MAHSCYTTSMAFAVSARASTLKHTLGNARNRLLFGAIAIQTSHYNATSSLSAINQWSYYKKKKKKKEYLYFLEYNGALSQRAREVHGGTSTEETSTFKREKKDKEEKRRMRNSRTRKSITDNTCVLWHLKLFHQLHLICVFGRAPLRVGATACRDRWMLYAHTNSHTRKHSQRFPDNSIYSLPKKRAG